MVQQNDARLEIPQTWGYQLYSSASESLTAEIPESLTFEQDVVLPLAFSTAGVGLYLPQYLGLTLPFTAERAIKLGIADRLVLLDRQSPRKDRD